MKKIPVVIDTDPGIDDFFAIMLANSLENLDIRAIMSVAGNQVVEKVSDNLKRICGLLDINTRLSIGAPKPIVGEQITAGHIHGENGLGNLILSDNNLKFDTLSAWDVIYEEAKKSQGDLRIIALGPLTNVAIAILKYPDLKNYIKDIVIMGGSTNTGNVSIYGEFNIVADPEAADIVFKSKIPLTMVGLNVTHETGLIKEEVDELLSIECKYSKEVKHLLEFLRESELAYDFSDVILHDALTVAYAADERVLEVKDFPVYIETRGKLNRGRTVVDLDNWRKDKIKNARVAIDVDKRLYFNMLKDMLMFYK